MRRITKQAEPPSLTDHRIGSHAFYRNYKEKQDLRQALVDEQRGICCFCMEAIQANYNTMKIAHWEPQSTAPLSELDYANLLGACLGNQGSPKKTQHCDTHQGNLGLNFNPANPSFPENEIRYQPDGGIATDNQALDKDLKTLNLDAAIPKNERKSVLTSIIEATSRHSDRGQLEAWLSEWNGTSHAGPLKPYCMVGVYWFRRILAAKAEAT